MIEVTRSPNRLNDPARDDFRLLRDEMSELHARLCRGIGDPRLVEVVDLLRSIQLNLRHRDNQTQPVSSTTSANELVNSVGIGG